MLGEEYVKLAFRLNKHVVGLVDSYFGPGRLEEEVEAEQVVPLPKLKEHCASLKASVGAHGRNEEHRVYLLKQLDALQAQIDERLGLVSSFQTYARRLFDVDGGPADETELQTFRQHLSVAMSELGYAGDLRSAILKWEEDQVIGGQPMFDLVNVLLHDARARTNAMIDLPQGEEVAVESVQNRPWSGYNWYQGNFRSLIQINTDLPRTRLEIEDLVTHEAYPGHHTDHASKEKALYVEQDLVEASILLINTPSSVMSEGLASYAHALICEGVDPPRKAARLLRKLRRGCDLNACLMLHAQGTNPDTVQRYLETNALVTTERARKRLEFVTDPLWRAYAHTYWKGERLVEQAFAQARAAGKTREVTDLLYKELLCPTTLVKKVREIC